jgi:hypothetical protein
MLHSRRKAEIEILTTMKPDLPADNPENCLSDRRQQLENMSALHCSPYHDATGHLANDRTDSQFFNYSNTVPFADSPITSIPTSLRSSGQVTSPSSSPLIMLPVRHSTPPTHAPLLRYLVRKIAHFIAQAEARATAMEIDT